jgi:hypothetical protein
MPDRRWVVYKTPPQRIIETITVLLFTLASATIWHLVLPGVGTSAVVLASLILGFTLVPILGTRIAERRGAPLVSREERTRRYLAELGPLARPGAVPAFGSAGSRRTGGRSLRR